ncbi:MAG: chemotaxis protein CheW [Nitrospirae bacterium]|nr:chemotaxis protein CheW [Nitrospirota bacterium]
METKVHTDAHQFLTFFLRGEEFGLGILQVKEILEYGTLTRVPMVPDFIKGVINLRGHVVPVIDLGAKFHMPPGEVTSPDAPFRCDLLPQRDDLF